jgi:phage shock protein A
MAHTHIDLYTTKQATMESLVEQLEIERQAAMFNVEDVKTDVKKAKAKLRELKNELRQAKLRYKSYLAHTPETLAAQEGWTIID